MCNSLHTFDHILDMTADGSHSSNFLLGSEPLLDQDLLAIHHSHVHRQMTEVASQLASRSANRHDASIDLGGHAFRYLHRLIRVDCSHFVPATKKQSELKYESLRLEVERNIH